MSPEQQADLDAWNRLSRFEYDSAATIAAFRSWFALTPGEARLLEALYLQPETFIKTHALANQARLTTYTVVVYIGHLRDAMDAEAIDSEGPRYALTEIGFAECREALVDARRAA